MVLQTSFELGLGPYVMEYQRYMENVYPTNVFADPTEILAISDVANLRTNQCLDTLWHDQIGQPFGLYQCHGAGGSQSFVYTKTDRHIRPMANLEVCVPFTLSYHLVLSALSFGLLTLLLYLRS